MAKKLRALLDKIDDLPEVEREYYTQVAEGPHKGKYLAGVESVGGFALEDIQGLRNGLVSERDKREALERAQKAYAELGDPDAIRKALDDVKKMSSWTPDDKVQGRIDAEVAAVKREFEKERASAKEMLETRNRAIRNLAITAQGRAALQKLGADPTMADLLMLELERSAVEHWQEGQDVPAVRIRAENGKDFRASTKRDGHMDIEEYAERVLREKYPSAFKGDGRNGSGATGGNAANGSSNGSGARLTKSDARDPAKYAAAKAAAVKAGQAYPEIVEG